MPKTLDVYLENSYVGNLIQDNYGLMLFKYDEKWLDNPAALPLSNSLPLRKELFKTKECRAFFAGVLPEANNRIIIARILGISAQNDFSLLEKIGGECAGAVTFLPTGDPLKTSDYDYQVLDNNQLAKILRELPRRPLMVGTENVRISLAGAQDKIAVCINAEGHISIPHGAAISTHILKPAIERFEGVVFNEALCMKLANAIGLPSAKVEIRRVEDIDYLLVERYDRKQMIGSLAHSYPQRVHQEDFCQALVILPENKYQNEGGPSLKRCFNLLREVSTAPVIDLQTLLDYVIFNFLVGNNDAHGKNFSILYDRGTILTEHSKRLAPLYDVLCTVHYPDISRKMAMKIGNEYNWDLIIPKHFDKFAEEVGLSQPLVKKRVCEVAQRILSKIDEMSMDHSVSMSVSKLIQQHCESRIRDFQ